MADQVMVGTLQDITRPPLPMERLRCNTARPVRSECDHGTVDLRLRSARLLDQARRRGLHDGFAQSLLEDRRWQVGNGLVTPGCGLGI
jgi:hypothetical protein